MQGTLGLTIGLVVLVIYLFLGRLIATLIPGIAVPLSLVATFGLMYLLGYSIDNISLLGLTLSVGLVVDDAIVMLENIVRRTEHGEPPMHAALEGSREVTGTIMSMSLSLVAVFLPILLMGGVVGRILNEFGVVVTLAILAFGGGLADGDADAGGAAAGRCIAMAGETAQALGPDHRWL